MSALPLPSLPPRRPDAHKGDFGRALLVGGSRGMAGAIALSGISALRSGAGLVTLAVPDRCLETVAGFDPCYMTIPLPCDSRGRLDEPAAERVAELAAAATCVACGPGLGRSAPLTRLVRWMYAYLPQPMVVDADGLNALAADPKRLSEPGGPRIVTPHPGEFRRLIGGELLPREDLPRRARELAGEHGIVVVLKGHRTQVSDGDRCTHNDTGNPGMATGGTGDVLTGVITALVCQGLGMFEAAQLGVHVHGLAGDLAAQRCGQVSLTATEVIQLLPAAFQCVQPSG